MAEFIVLTKGTGGDLYPFVQICAGLRIRGHLVTLMTESRFEAVVKGYGLDFVPLYSDDQIDCPAASGPGEGGASGGVFDLEQISIHFQICLNLYRYLESRGQAGRTVVISHDNLNIVSQTVAEALGLPYVLVFTSPYFLSTMPIQREVLAAESGIINRFRSKLRLHPVDDWERWLKMPGRVIGLWPEWFAPHQAEWMYRVAAVGFVWSKEFETGEIPAEIKEFIIDSKSIVLITHGTSKPDSRSFFQAGIDACLALGSNGIIVTPHDEIALEYATNNIRRYKYLPFASLLPHLGIIIHHGGIGTLNQALTAGIPQLVLSSGIDRPDNGRRLKRLGVGECLPPLRWQTESVAAALLRLMTPEVKERCRQLSVCQTNTEDPAAAACDIIESVIQP